MYPRGLREKEHASDIKAPHDLCIIYSGVRTLFRAHGLNSFVKALALFPLTDGLMLYVLCKEKVPFSCASTNRSKRHHYDIFLSSCPPCII